MEMPARFRNEDMVDQYEICGDALWKRSVVISALAQRSIMSPRNSFSTTIPAGASQNTGIRNIGNTATTDKEAKME